MARFLAGQSVVLKDPRTGATRWERRLDSTWLPDVPGQAWLADPLNCGELQVTRLGARGTTVWSRKLSSMAAVNGADRLAPVVEIDLGPGDLNADGVADWAVLQLAREAAPSNDNCIGQPSGYCRSVTQPVIAARLSVVDGARGRLLLSVDAGSGQTTAPSAAWSGDGKSIVWAAPRDATTVDLYRRNRTSTDAAVLTVPTLTDLRVLATSPPVLQVSASDSSAYALSGVLVGLDQRTLAQSWTLPLSVHDTLVKLSSSTLLLSNGMTLTGTALNPSDGSPRWVAPAPAASGGAIDLVGRLDVPSTDAFSMIDYLSVTSAAVVASGRDGHVLFPLDLDEVAQSSCVNPGRLMTVTGPYADTPTVRLRDAKGTVLWSSPASLGQHGLRAHTCASAQGGVVLAYADGNATQQAFDLKSGKPLWTSHLQL